MTLDSVSYCSITLSIWTIVIDPKIYASNVSSENCIFCYADCQIRRHTNIQDICMYVKSIAIYLFLLFTPV